MGTDSSSEQSKRRGFSLVESAIVLAVVGLVLGGIWWAASAISTAREVSDIKEYILYCYNIAQKYSRTYMPTVEYGNNKIFYVDAVLDRTKPLPGNFHWVKNGSYYEPVSANNRVLVWNYYLYEGSWDGVNYARAFGANPIFWDFKKDVPTTRPAVCAGLLSWVIRIASSQHVHLSLMDVNFNDTSDWDSQSGTAPPSTSLCGNVSRLYIYFW